QVRRRVGPLATGSRKGECPVPDARAPSSRSRLGGLFQGKRTEDAAMSRWSTQGRAMALARTRIMRLVAGVRVLSWLPSAMILAGCSTSGVLAEAPIISSGYFGVGGFGNQSVYWL